MFVVVIVNEKSTDTGNSSNIWSINITRVNNFGLWAHFGWGEWATRIDVIVSYFAILSSTVLRGNGIRFKNLCSGVASPLVRRPDSTQFLSGYVTVTNRPTTAPQMAGAWRSRINENFRALGLIEHGFTSAPTQYRLYGRRGAGALTIGIEVGLTPYRPFHGLICYLAKFGVSVVMLPIAESATENFAPFGDP